jgi:hypothetical protein
MNEFHAVLIAKALQEDLPEFSLLAKLLKPLEEFEVRFLPTRCFRHTFHLSAMIENYTEDIFVFHSYSSNE